MSDRIGAVVANKNFLITGATSGIGRATAMQLGRLGGRLVLTGRNQRKGDELAARLQQETPGVKAEFVSADISVFSEVHQLADWFCERFGTLDVLINNAGARFDTYEQTEDGIERTFATNHLGHFLLTALLLDPLSNGLVSRVVTVTSCARRSGSPMSDWLLVRESFDRKRAYAQSKLANVLFACELAWRSQGSGLISNAVDPGVAATNFARNNGLIAWCKHLVSHRIRGDLRSAVSAARTVVYCATSNSVERVSGQVFYNCAEVPLSSMETDRNAASELWTSSIGWTGLKAHPFAGDRFMDSNGSQVALT